MARPGTIDTTNLASAVPVFATPYRRLGKGRLGFTDIDCLTFKYRTTSDKLHGLLPSNLSVEENPIVTLMFLTYGFTSIGPYKELIHNVEVFFQGKKYDYPILLVLDNEDAVYGGREQWGFPKVLGTLQYDFGSDGQSGFLQGRCERPVSNPIAEFLFKPIGLLETNAISQSSNPGLNLRIIPSPVPGAPPSVRQYLQVNFRLVGGETWEGVGSLKFPSTSEFDPLHRFPVVEYISTTLTRKCTGVLTPPEAIFDF